MDHGDYRVKILDDQGNVIGAKPRKEIDKVHDIVHCADVFVIQKGKLVLARLPFYGNTLGAAAATMVREGEAAETAAARAMQKELGVALAHLELLGEEFFSYDDGIKRLKTSYLCLSDTELVSNPEDTPELVSMGRDELVRDLAVHPEHFSPTFIPLWERYQEKLF